MAQGRNDDGTLDVRVALIVRVNPEAWAERMMMEGTGDTEIRRDVKRWVREYINGDDNVVGGIVPLEVVRVEGIYD